MVLHTARRGNTIVEYGFIAVLVLVGMLGILFLLGNNFNQALQGVRGDLAQNVQSARTVNGIVQSGGMGGVIGPPGPGQRQQCTESGWCFNVPSSMGTRGATTGSMGQQFYSSLMEQILMQMDALGIEDPALRSLLTKLANTGDTIGKRQRSIAGKCPPRARCILTNTWDLSQIQTNAETFEQLQQRLVNYLANNPTALPQEVNTMVMHSTYTISGIAAQYYAGNALDDAQRNATVTLASAGNLCTQGIAGRCDATHANIDGMYAVGGGSNGRSFDDDDDDD